MEMDKEIRNKIRKIYRLAKDGIAGESDAAQAALERWLEKYNVTLSDVLEDAKELHTIYGADMWQVQLALQIAHMLDLDANKFQEKKGAPYIRVECTPAEFVEFKAMTEFYSAGLQQEILRLYKGFVLKQELYGDTAKVQHAKDMTPEERAEAWKVLKMRENLEKRDYYKQLKDEN